MTSTPQSRIILTRTEDEFCSHVSLSFSANHDLTFVLEQLESFLKAVGFILDGQLDIVPPEDGIDLPESGSIEPTVDQVSELANKLGVTGLEVDPFWKVQPRYGNSLTTPDPRVLQPHPVTTGDPMPVGATICSCP